MNENLENEKAKNEGSQKTKKTDSEMLEELDRSKDAYNKKKQITMARIDKNLLKEIRRIFGSRITADTLAEKIANANTENSANDQNSERRISIAKYVESITSPDVTVEQFQDLMNRLERKIKPREGEIDQYGTPITEWQNRPLAESVQREYENPGSTR